jgi:hypothetical protein
MGLSWQEGPAALTPAGALLVRGRLPERMLYATRRGSERSCGGARRMVSWRFGLPMLVA